MKYLFSALFLLLGMTLSANADVLNSWEGSDIGSPDGWIVDPAGKAQTVAFSSIGVTDGSQSLELTNVQGGGYEELIRLENPQFLADMLAHTKLELDVFVPGTSVGVLGVFWGKAFLQFEGVLTTTVDLNFDGGVAGKHPHYIAANGFLDTVGTLSIDYQDHPSWNPAAGFARATVVVQGPPSGGAPDNNPVINSPIYVDNFRLTGTAVPEPTSVALLAMGGMLCGARRRVR